MSDIIEFIEGLPKVELHMHLEGSLEAELMAKLADRNKVEFPFENLGELKAAYNFLDSKQFLDSYYKGVKVLQSEQDFYDLTTAYMNKAVDQNILHTEIFFDPQAHTNRGVSFSEMVEGISAALKEAESKADITSRLIMCFSRHLSEKDAFKTLEEAIPYNNKIMAIGLDSYELGNPPSKFERVFERAKEYGFRFAVAHAGGDAPVEYIEEAINLLRVNRVDHGDKSVDDLNLMNRIIDSRTALTLCPLSNLKLSVVKSLKQYPLKTMLDAGVMATINSDSPSYFGGYINENFIAVAEALNLSKGDLVRLVENSIEASFANDLRKIDIRKSLGKYIAEYGEASLLH